MSIRGKVWINRSNKQKLVTIPKYCEIQPGDLVRIEKIDPEEIEQ
jgi:hypothetical protein